MAHRDLETMLHLLDSTTQALFADYNTHLVPVTHASSTTIAAIIGYSGRDLCGNLCLTTVPALADRSYGSVAPADWLGELSNQLLGRVKSELARRGVEVFLTTPLVLRGYRLELCATGQEEEVDSALFDYSSPSGPLRVMLQFEFKPGCSLGPTQRVKDALDVCESVLF